MLKKFSAAALSVMLAAVFCAGLTGRFNKVFFNSEAARNFTTYVVCENETACRAGVKLNGANAEENLKTEKTEAETKNKKSGAVAAAKSGAFFSRSLKIVTERAVYEYYYPQLYYGENGLSLLGLDDEVNRIYYDNYVAPVNAEVIFKPNAQNVFTYKPEKAGRYISERKIKAEIEYCLASGKSFARIGSQSIQPEITRKELEKTACVRSRFATAYSSSSEERKSNIALAASAVSGCVLKAGESFSFNERVGERTEARGYKKAKIISNGDFTEGVGGGVCQVSTTLYNAALKAGLTIEECHRHSLPVSYVSPSFDALVNSGTSDLRLKNDTGADVFIACYADGEKLSAVIYGLENEYEYRLISRVTETIPAETIEEITADLPAGVKEETVKPHDGLKSEGYLCVYRNGKEVFSKKIRSDVYAPRKGVVRVGKTAA